MTRFGLAGRHPWLGVPLAVLLATAGLSVLGAEEARAGQADEIVPSMRHTSIGTFEPTIGVTGEGTVFMSAVGRDGANWSTVQRSRESGETWRDVTPQIAPGVSFPPQSNDPYLPLDEATDCVFVSDLQATVCSTLAFSDDRGASWTKNPLGCGHPLGSHDHQTVFTGPPRTAEAERGLEVRGYESVVHYCVNRLADTACARSLDGGENFGPLRPLVYNTDPEAVGGDDRTPTLEACTGGLTGQGVTGPDGTVYLGTGECETPLVTVSRDDGLTWDVAALSGPEGVWEHDVNLAVDDGGTAAAVWPNGTRQLRLAASTDRGETWTDPVTVGPPEVEAFNFPAIAAGEDGEFVLAYYGTAPPAADVNHTNAWHAYLTLLEDPTEGPASTTTVRVNPAHDPVARGPCEDRCDDVGDFIDASVGPEGRPWGAFVDVCNDDCATPNGTENGPDERGFAATLLRGPTLRGEGALTPLAPTPPDLQALTLPVDNGPWIPGEEHELAARVGNLGETAVENATVRFLADGEPVGTVTLDRLEARSQARVGGPSIAPAEGTVEVPVHVDPDDRVRENYEHNNRENRTLPVGCSAPGPDAFGYTCEVVPGDFVDVSAEGDRLGLRDEAGELSLDPLGAQDARFQSVQLPFAFPFYEQVFREVQVSDNGILAFGPTWPSTRPPPAAAPPNAAPTPPRPTTSSPGTGRTSTPRRPAP